MELLKVLIQLVKLLNCTVYSFRKAVYDPNSYFDSIFWLFDQGRAIPSDIIVSIYQIIELLNWLEIEQKLAHLCVIIAFRFIFLFKTKVKMSIPQSNPIFSPNCWCDIKFNLIDLPVSWGNTAGQMEQGHMRKAEVMWAVSGWAARCLRRLPSLT